MFNWFYSEYILLGRPKSRVSIQVRCYIQNWKLDELKTFDEVEKKVSANTFTGVFEMRLMLIRWNKLNIKYATNLICLDKIQFIKITAVNYTKNYRRYETKI